MCISSLGCQRSTYIVFTQGCGCTYVSRDGLLYFCQFFHFCTLYMGVCTTVAFFFFIQGAVSKLVLQNINIAPRRNLKLYNTRTNLYIISLLYIWQIENKHTIGLNRKRVHLHGANLLSIFYSVSTKFTKCGGH